MSGVADYEPDHDEWVECWNCAGDGETEDCFEDTCVCIDPPCLWRRCDVCRGKGGWPMIEQPPTQEPARQAAESVRQDDGGR